MKEQGNGSATGPIALKLSIATAFGAVQAGLAGHAAWSATGGQRAIFMLLAGFGIVTVIAATGLGEVIYGAVLRPRAKSS